ADGMGGHRGGEVASRLAVEEVGAAFHAEAGRAPEEILSEAFERANRKIFERAERDASLSGMGTTGVALLLSEDTGAWVAHVGDSRLYRLRRGEMKLLTSDHSVVGELVRRGQISLEEARVHPQSNEILRAIGTRLSLQVDLRKSTCTPRIAFFCALMGSRACSPTQKLRKDFDPKVWSL
ncbi:protein phosphatase 2C domain-containing protein, partial [Myxococcota bacterium]|nr:protein phosphatase 2C domain-containing protein [Myxococcota bacterium]